MAAVFFGPLAFGAVEPWARTTLECLLFGCLFCAIMRPAPETSQTSIRGTVMFAALGILAVGLAQQAGGGSPSGPASLGPLTIGGQATRRALVLWGAFASLLWCAPLVAGSRSSARRLVWTVFLIGAVVAVIGISQRGQGDNAYYGLRPVRHGAPFGPYPNYDHAASLMVMSLCAGLGLILARLERLRQEHSARRRSEMSAQLALAAFLAAVITFGIWQTHSRGGILSLCAAAWLCVFLGVRRIGSPLCRRAAYAALLSAAAGGAVLLSLDPSWIGFVFSEPDTSVAYRLSIYRTTLHILKDFPVFGTGLGTFTDVFPVYKDGILQQFFVEHAHNDWLELAVGTGLTGLLAWAAGLLLFLRRMIRIWLDCPSQELFWVGGGILAAILAFLLHGLVDFSFQIPANAAIFLILLCVLDGVLHAAQRADPDAAPESA